MATLVLFPLDEHENGHAPDDVALSLRSRLSGYALRGALPRDDKRRVGTDEACATDGSPTADSGIRAIGSTARVGQFCGHFSFLMRHRSHDFLRRRAAPCTTAPITGVSLDPAAPSSGAACSGTINAPWLDAELSGKDGRHPVHVSRASLFNSGDNSNFPAASSRPSIDASSSCTSKSPDIISKCRDSILTLSSPSGGGARGRGRFRSHAVAVCSRTLADSVDRGCAEPRLAGTRDQVW